jgi:hypothetical protein
MTPNARHGHGRALAAALLCIAATLLPACGVGDGYRFGSAYRADIDSVAVPIFENATTEVTLEQTLTEAIIKEIHRSTPWKVLPRGRAQTELSGVITNVDLRKLVTDQTSGLGQELAVTLTVSFQWRDARTGEVLVARRNYRAAEPFVPAVGAQERIELGQRAAIQQLARDIVAELRGSW